MKKYYILLMLQVFTFKISAQNRNNIWCFGESAGIDFSNLSTPINIHSAVKSRGSCVSIADTNSNLLFYAYTRASVVGNTTYVKDRNNNLMLNGTNIVGEGWYNELVIIPVPDDTLQYYLFSIGVTGSSSSGLYYSTIDMSYNNGLGQVTSKNNQLLPDPANDGLTAVKHGNGRDWWLTYKKCGLCSGGGGPDNTFYKYLITPIGIQGPFLQNIGSLMSTNTWRYQFNADGSQMASLRIDGECELYDFDRCSGLLSNYHLIRPSNTAPPTPYFFSIEFSASGQYLYIATSGYQAPSYLIQVDLLNPLGYAAADTIAALTTIPNAGGMLRRAPDNKIYWSCIYDNGFNFSYPYADTMYNMYNMNLSVINAPDSPGTACNFNPYSFYLGGARTYWGLPNNPNYDLPRLQGSSCDTVLWTGLPNPSKGWALATLQASYVEAWQKLFVNAQNIKGKNVVLKIYDLNGRIVFSSSQKTQPPYFTQDVDVSSLSYGMYIVNLETESEVLNKKFVKSK